MRVFKSIHSFTKHSLRAPTSTLIGGETTEDNESEGRNPHQTPHHVHQGLLILAPRSTTRVIVAIPPPTIILLSLPLSLLIEVREVLFLPLVVEIRGAIVRPLPLMSGLIVKARVLLMRLILLLVLIRVLRLRRASRLLRGGGLLIVEVTFLPMPVCLSPLLFICFAPFLVLRILEGILVTLSSGALS